MKINKVIRAFIRVFTLSLIMLFSCSETPSCIERCLQHAYDNRAELEMVLNHYENDPEKLAAAKFLIENMPGHYSFVDTARVERFYYSLDSLLNTMYINNYKTDYSAICKAVTDLYHTHGADKFETTSDLCIIKSEFLINQIDTAFEQWYNIPWCRNLDFNQFCEFLLPYKVTETQSLTPLDSPILDILADSLARMSSCAMYRTSAFEAAEVANRMLRRNFSFTPENYRIPHLYYDQITRLKVPFGTCDDLCHAGISFFRAAGIPVAIDYIPLWGYCNIGHTWGVVHAPNGKDMPVIPVYMSPYTMHKINERALKVYRRTYAHNDDLVELNSSGEWVPTIFRNVFQRDVTPLYYSTFDLTISVDSPSEYAYLCSPNRYNWEPVAVSKIKRGNVTFKDVADGNMLLIATYDKIGNFIPLSNPIIFDNNGLPKEVIADLEHTKSLTLYRKWPLLEYAWRLAISIEGGEFEASNDPSFTDAVKVGVVNTPPEHSGELKIDAGAYRYWRYIQRGDSAKCYVNEITLLSNGENVTEKGKPIGNYPGEPGGLGNEHYAFDGDVLSPTSFIVNEEAWIGLDFGKPMKIDMIRYVPRSDGNMIEPGDTYELSYWHGGRWNSLGKKIATSVSIEYDNVPDGALLILRDLTKGKEERIFMIDENGKQEWW